MRKNITLVHLSKHLLNSELPPQQNMTKTQSLFIQDAQLGKGSRWLGRSFKYSVVGTIMWSNFEEGSKRRLHKFN